MKIPFYSTNKESLEVSVRDAILKGQCPDKGLYMPLQIPKITSIEMDLFRNMEYHEIANIVLSKYLHEFIPEDILQSMCKDAYNFEVPIENVTQNRYVLRLDRGPTASFKDFAARIMARLMNYFLKQDDDHLLILTATSGDTGGAVADAFFGQSNVDVIVLFPIGEISERQRKQMTTLGQNIKAIGVKGKFDDCQKLVKQAFSDKDLQHLNLSSANSINIARLLPQTVYYFFVYSRVTSKNSEKIIISVPSGNFGNLVGGIIAQRMGLPVKTFVSSVNENDEFPKFLETGIYQKIEPSKNCLSNAMNVGHPSNLARLIDLFDGQMDENGIINKMPNMNILRSEIYSVSISDDKTKETMLNTYQNYGVLLEPHGAVGYAGLEWFLNRDRENAEKSVASVSFETADPAKFPEVITELLGMTPKMSENLARVQSREEIDKDIISINYSNFKTRLLRS